MLCIVSLSAGAALAQLPPPERCVSQDLTIIGASVVGNGCVTCEPGQTITSTLSLQIHNKTGSHRTAFSFWGTLEIWSGGVLVSSMDVNDCNDDGFPGGTTTGFESFEVTYTCGDQIKLTNIYMAWTDAADIGRNQCPAIEANPDKIAPKCGTLQEIVVATPLFASAEAGTIACHGGTTTLTALATGGTAPYQYSINGGASWQSSPAFTVGDGSYTILVKDAMGCTAESDEVLVSQPDELLAGASAGAIMCHGGSTTLTASATGGTSPYLYSIDGGSSWQASPEFTVSSGTYTVLVKDAMECTDAASPLTIGQPAALIADAEAGTISCHAGTTTLTASATGGTPPYAYSIDGGTTWQPDPAFTVSAGTHTVLVQDANLCRDDVVISIGDPDALVAGATHGTIACHGGTTTLEASASGGTSPYEFSIDGGSSWQSESSFTVEAGTYTITVRDAMGCMDATDPIPIGEPSAVEITAVVPTDVSCDGPATGTITVTASGGTGSLEYSLDNSSWQPGNVFTELTAGAYTVYVRDANLCPAQASVTINPAMNCLAEGCTLGYWKNHTDRWCDAYSPETVYGSIFTAAPARLRNLTFLQVLNLQGGGIYNLARQSVAALLNACHPNVDYELSTSAIIEGVNAAFLNGTAGAYATYLDGLNNAGCPLGGTPATTSARTLPGKEAGSGLDSELRISTYPNPFRGATTLEFSSPVKTRGVLEVFTMDGKEVSVLFRGDMEAGQTYKAEFRLENRSSQLFFYILRTDQGNQVGRVISLE
ncbi:SprB repeat-containing protein [Cesiribacter andamanensis]|nr:SprB repeat-containing protein [Cesiribacter andamanensis]